jgi:hypothetical protein
MKAVLLIQHQGSKSLANQYYDQADEQEYPTPFLELFELLLPRLFFLSVMSPDGVHQRLRKLLVDLTGALELVKNRGVSLGRSYRRSDVLFQLMTQLPFIDRSGVMRIEIVVDGLPVNRKKNIDFVGCCFLHISRLNIVLLFQWDQSGSYSF